MIRRVLSSFVRSHRSISSLSSSSTLNSSTMSVDVAQRYDNLDKSPLDNRLYRGLQLSNGLKAILVSDPTTDKSAAAVDVNIGFLSDPDRLPGLAHFCEHMLFLGTEKYPEENTYSKFLSEHGGSSNACTCADNTYYFFDVLPEHLPEALDIFSQFFLSPLFTPDCTGRELLAVNSEHEKNIRVDFWRTDQLNRLIADQNHPHSKFGTGNQETLEIIPKKMGIDVHSELLKFHNQWYSSNIMSLVIFGKESLDDLEKLAVKNFSSIANLNVTAPTWTSPYLPEHLGVKINVVPIKDIRHLHIDFPIPDSKQNYASGPVYYISHLVGHEGPGSLLSLLKAKGWCNSLNSGPQDGGRGFGLFDISVDLTETGISHIDEIIELVFQYIHLIKNKGVQKWIFDEISSLYATNFRFKDKEEPRNFAAGIVHSIQQYPMENVLTAHYYLTDWRPDLIEDLLAKLHPKNVRIAVIAKCFENICDRNEKWYGTKYHLEKISDEIIERWSNCEICYDLNIPPPNNFIPDSFDLASKDADFSEYPEIIHDTPIIRVWFKQDDEYLLPKLNCFFDFSNPTAYSDPLNTNLNALFVSLFQDDLNEYAYAAELAGINYHIRNTRNGISIRVDGFDSKQHVLLTCLVDKMVNFKVNPGRFSILKEVYLRDLRNFEMQPPYQHSAFHLSMALIERAWSKKDFLKAADAITVESLQEFIGNFLTKLHVECFIHGNATKLKALEIISIVENRLPKNILPLLPQQLLLAREIQLEKGNHYRLEIDHTIHSDSCALIYLQCGLENTTLNVISDFIVQILTEPCFDILRTKEQLGYMVFSGVRNSNGIRGLRIIVQSIKHPNYVESRIEAFLHYMLSYLETLSSCQFEKHRESLIAHKLKRPKMLMGLSYELKSEISSQQYHFNRANVEVDRLRQVTIENVIDFYKETIAITSPTRQKLSIHVISSAEGGAGRLNQGDHVNPKSDVNLLPVPEDPTKITLINDLVTFKSGCSLFPLVAPYINIPRKGAHCKL